MQPYVRTGDLAPIRIEDPMASSRQLLALNVYDQLIIGDYITLSVNVYIPLTAQLHTQLGGNHRIVFQRITDREGTQDA